MAKKKVFNKNIKKYSTSNIKKENKKEDLILHLKIKKGNNTANNTIALFDYNNENPKPHEPKILENNLCNYSSNIENNLNFAKNNSNNSDKKQIVINLMNDFIKGENGEWPTKTNIYCYWCCHPFNNIPCGIPEKYVNGKFYLIDCFCSFNCTASHILKNITHNKWEKYTLLNL